MEFRIRTSYTAMHMHGAINCLTILLTRLFAACQTARSKLLRGDAVLPRRRSQALNLQIMRLIACAVSLVDFRVRGCTGTGDATTPQHHRHCAASAARGIRS